MLWYALYGTYAAGTLLVLLAAGSKPRSSTMLRLAAAVGGLMLTTIAAITVGFLAGVATTAPAGVPA